MYTYVYMYVCMYVSKYVCMYLCMYVCMYACMYVCMYVCTHMYIHIYICSVEASRVFEAASYCLQPPSSLERMMIQVGRGLLLQLQLTGS